jgi:hypothetical protein
MLLKKLKETFDISVVEKTIVKNPEVFKDNQNVQSYKGKLEFLRFLLFPISFILLLITICFGLISALMFRLGTSFDLLFTMTYDFTWVPPFILGLKDENVSIILPLAEKEFNEN